MRLPALLTGVFLALALAACGGGKASPTSAANQAATSTSSATRSSGAATPSTASTARATPRATGSPAGTPARATPFATPLASPPVGTPVAGSPYQIGVAATVGNLRVTPARARILPPGTPGLPPPRVAGESFAAVQVTIANGGSSDFTVNPPSQFFLVDRSGRTYPGIQGAPSEITRELGSPIKANSTATGEVVFETPVDAPITLIRFQNGNAFAEWQTQSFSTPTP